jgi:hypothetical protein
LSTTPKYRESHEIHLRRAGKWTIDYMGLKPMQAGELAQTAFREPSVDGLRIIRSRESTITGAVIEETLLEKSRTAQPAEAVVGAIEDAPYCQKGEDLFRAQARLTLHRLFHGWLGVHEVGVTECLLSTKLIERLMDRGSLIQSATFHVAQLQIPEAGDPTRRREQLLAFMDDLKALNESTERISKRGHVPDAEDASQARLSPFVTLWRIGEDLLGLQNRLSKIERLGQKLEAVEDAATLDAIDHFLSDYLMDEDLVLEIAGPHSSVIEPLHWIVEAAMGGKIGGGAKPSPHDFMTPIIQALHADRLPRTRQALLWSLDGLLRGTTPLKDESPGAEKAALLLLTKYLSSAGLFGGGPRLAARLTQRFAEFEDKGGTAGFLEAAETLAIDLSDPRRQIRYLSALISGSTIGRSKAGLMRILDGCIRLYGGPEKLASSSMPTHVIIQEYDSLCALLESMEIGPKSREAWTGSLVACLRGRVERDRESGADIPRFLGDLLNSDVLGSDAVSSSVTALRDA